MFGQRPGITAIEQDWLNCSEESELQLLLYLTFPSCLFSRCLVNVQASQPQAGLNLSVRFYLIWLYQTSWSLELSRLRLSALLHLSLYHPPMTLSTWSLSLFPVLSHQHLNVGFSVIFVYRVFCLVGVNPQSNSPTFLFHMKKFSLCLHHLIWDEWNIISKC